MQVSLGCDKGYTEAVGDTGYKTMQCKQKVSSGGSGLDVEWSVDENNRLTCVRKFPFSQFLAGYVHGLLYTLADARRDPIQYVSI
jgi:hypothetical protein